MTWVSVLLSASSIMGGEAGASLLVQIDLFGASVDERDLVDRSNKKAGVSVKFRNPTADFSCSCI